MPRAHLLPGFPFTRRTLLFVLTVSLGLSCSPRSLSSPSGPSDATPSPSAKVDAQDAPSNSPESTDAPRETSTVPAFPPEAQDKDPHPEEQSPEQLPIGIERWKSALENYVPTVAPSVEARLDPETMRAFAQYITQTHGQIHPFFAKAAIPSLERLPADHRLNSNQLETTVELVIQGRGGRFVRAGVLKSSGVTAFDLLALDSIARAAPFPSAPERIRSIDGNVYLSWTFYRDPMYACSTYFAFPHILSRLPQPPLIDEVGAPLPQTKEKPSAESRWFEQNAHLLFEAIVADDIDRALPFFFPEEAYAQVKDIPDPSQDWKNRLVAAYAKDIHEYHKALGKHRGAGQFERLKVAETMAHWVEPGKELNKVGYYRVMRSVLLYRDHTGHQRELGVHTMISWRGQWYVVHLRPFK